MDIRSSALLQAFTFLLPFLSSPDRRSMASGLSLLVANLVPIFGILLFGWEPALVMLLYWLESAVIAVFNICKMLLASVFDKDGSFQPLGILGGAFLSAFFTVHFGIFMLVHGIFLIVFMRIGFLPAPRDWALPDMTPPGMLESVLQLFWRGDWGATLGGPASAVVAMFLSHGISFVIHFVRGREYVAAETGNLMLLPYRRIFVMHLTIILGAFAVVGLAALGVTAPAIVVVLVVLKTVADLRAHSNEHTQPGQVKTQGA